MAEQRVTCTYLGGIKRIQIYDLNRLYADATVYEEVRKNIGDLVGYLNLQDSEQYPPVPVPGPDPDPTDPLSGFRARQLVGQNCAWVLMTPQEASALEAALGAAVYKEHTQFYTVGGSGGLGLNELAFADSPSGYKFVQNDTWVPDVGGAADAAVLAAAIEQQRVVPAPVTV